MIYEEDQLRIISMQKGGDVKQVFTRLAKGIKAVQESVKKESGKDFCLDKKYGYIHSCPTNLGTGMRASVHVDLQGWTEKAGVDRLQARCEELHLQPRGTRGESGGQTGHTYDISNKHRLGYSEVELVQKMIDGVNTLWKEDKAMMGGAAPPAISSSGSGKYKPMAAQTNGPFPTIQSKHSLVAKHVTKDKWEQLKGIKTRPSLALLSSTTSTVESTPVTGTPTRTLPLSSTLSSVSTTESAPLPSTLPTWMPARSKETLSPTHPSTLAESALAVPSMALVFPLESLRSSVSELRSL